MPFEGQMRHQAEEVRQVAFDVKRFQGYASVRMNIPGRGVQQ